MKKDYWSAHTLLINKETAQKFAAYMKKYPVLYKQLASIVKENTLPSVRKPLIVDVGVGPGLLLKELQKKFPKAKIIGVDPSKNMLILAKLNVGNSHVTLFEPLLATAEYIPLQNESVDIVVSRFSLTYWKNPIESFNEIHRVLKQSGKIVFEVLNKDFPGWKLFVIKIRMLFNSASSNIIRYHIDAYETAYTIDSFRNILKKTGFEVESAEGTKKGWQFIVVAKKK